MLDFGISIYDADLELIAEASGITSFLGANDYAIRKGVELRRRRDARPGDVVLMNYPYWNGAHTYDATAVRAGVRRRRRAAGGLRGRPGALARPGRQGPRLRARLTEMHQEGLIFPGTKIVKGGVVDEEILELVRFNSRLPEPVIGDFYAQLAALRTGERRLHEIWEKFGFETVDAALSELILEHGERATRCRAGRAPDGSWTADGLARRRRDRRRADRACR